jgi:nitrous oxide reductase accessory protein NosL
MKKSLLKPILVCFIALMTFTACQDNSLEKGMKEVHWDRDVCERCTMIISEKKFTVQVMNPKTQQTYFFDDLGCAVIWFKEKNQDWFENAKIWINDSVSGQWLNAKEAIYLPDTLTPMGYGLSAFSKETITKHSNSLKFEQAVEKILEIDNLQKERRKQH